MGFRVRSTVWYVPNVIDYCRIGMLLVAIFQESTRPLLTIILIACASLMDGVDGKIARALHQESTLGATLDMSIDRCTGGIICMLLTSVLPKYSQWFITIMMVDIFSHWLRYSHYMRACVSHKTVDAATTRLLSFYYTTRWFLALLCVCYETALLSLLAYMTIPNRVVVDLAIVAGLLSSPFAGLKMIINVLQAVDAIHRLGVAEVEEGYAR
ncbi:CDP-diacylglycerol-inositol 3-phosphatidyltransferase [Giardia muris]|uniref:CDP-diacylglycerol--inositol 3-phosphatidyltransferase n=1 Tax=Giardia muris TaxID=5742 RepID=A0A4Z1T8X5_GIAMU|nr:CDP-diacylglycerol-inositol 3-phosphatidyltransferase [Giardia muris]|eukprot:TNJ28971.1 CDP-diacylglycerol-inositol 3-phosphatidyltransferase [Giardia muris]